MGNKIYIKFKDPTPASNLPKDGLAKKYLKIFIKKLVCLILPKANPDFEELIDDVEIWKLEYDIEKNCAWREIGFDKHGNSILIMPFNNNYGYWTDNNLTLDDFNRFDPIEISESEFENDWVNFIKLFKTVS